MNCPTCRPTRFVCDFSPDSPIMRSASRWESVWEARNCAYGPGWPNCPSNFAGTRRVAMNCDDVFDALTDPALSQKAAPDAPLAHCPRCRQLQQVLEPARSLLCGELPAELP